MTIVLNGTTGITNDGGYTGDGVVFADTTPANTLVTTTGGNVGIGTSSPGSNRLYINAPDGTAPLTLNSAGGSDTTRALNFNVAGDNYGKILVPSGSGGAMAFWTGGANAAAERARIDSSGNVGIGTSSPTAKLEVYDASSAVARVTAGTEIFEIRNTGSEVRLAVVSADPMTFRTSNVEAMRIDSSGNLLVGTTSATAKLSVEQTSATNAINAYINYASSTNIAGIRVTKYDNNTTTSQRFVEFVVNAGATGCGQINANGANTAAFGSYSDERLKENIVDLPSQLSNILALRPVEFDYIGVEDGHQIGFIAQEMQQVYPDAVSVGNDEMLMITAWSKTEARLVKAIQEQQAIITALTARVTALEGTQP